MLITCKAPAARIASAPALVTAQPAHRKAGKQHHQIGAATFESCELALLLIEEWQQVLVWIQHLHTSSQLINQETREVL